MKLQKGLFSLIILLVFVSFLASCSSKQELSEAKTKPPSNTVLFVIRPFHNAPRGWSHNGGWARLKTFRQRQENFYPQSEWGILYRPQDISQPLGLCADASNRNACASLLRDLGTWKSEVELKQNLQNRWPQILTAVENLKGHGTEVLEVQYSKTDPKIWSLKIHSVDSSISENLEFKAGLDKLQQSSTGKVWSEKVTNTEVGREVSVQALRNWSLESLQKMGRVQGIVLNKNFVMEGFFPGALTHEQWKLSYPEDDELVGADVNSKQVVLLNKLATSLDLETFGVMWKSNKGGKVMMTSKLYKDLERRGFRMSMFRFGATLETALKAELKRRPPF